jgi:hypothetical protein
MLFFNGRAVIQIGYCTGYLQDTGISASGEAEAIGEHIRKKRMNLCQLQREGAEIICVTVSSIYNWEHGVEPEL